MTANDDVRRSGLFSARLRMCLVVSGFLGACLLLCPPGSAWGQRRGGDDRGDWGRGRDRGGDRDAGGGRDAFRGGFPGGPQPWGGGGGGGPWGGGRGGGPPGGGFDPMMILQRMDSNGNSRLDPDEVDGRARFFVERFAPDVDLSRPVPFDEIRRRIDQRMGRSSGDGGGPEGTGGGPEGLAPLVPGFGVENPLPQVPGFGTTGEYFAVAITSADEEEALGVLRRYDRNGDGLLDAGEIRRGRWYDEPTAYDQNRDGKLSTRELAVRFARRRLAKEEQTRAESRRDREDRSRDRRQDGDRDSAEGQNRRSPRFLTAHERLPDDLPDWFRGQDLDQDGQVSMHEYATDWNDGNTEAYLRLDRNGDGVITPSEALDARDPATPASGDGSAQGTEEVPAAEASAAGGSAEAIPDKYLDYARSVISKYDTDGDGRLSAKEMESMRRKPDGADRDGDGIISAEEYARHVMK